MPKLPPKKTPVPSKPTPGKPKIDVPKAIKSAVHVLVPEATLAETGMAMILAGLGEQLGMHIAHIVEDKLHVKHGLPEKVPHWVVSLAQAIDRNARDAFLWRYQDRPVNEPRPEKSWEQIKKVSAGQAVPPQTPKAVAMVAVATEPEFDIFG